MDVRRGVRLALLQVIERRALLSRSTRVQRICGGALGHLELACPMQRQVLWPDEFAHVGSGTVALL